MRALLPCAVRTLPTLVLALMLAVPVAAVPSALDQLPLFLPPGALPSAIPDAAGRKIGVPARLTPPAPSPEQHVLSAQPAQATNFASAPNFSYESNIASRYVGLQAVTAGDVNGDGISDFVATGYINLSVGALYLFLGSTTGPVLAAGYPNLTIPAGAGLAPVGDVNGDGYDDIALFWSNSGTVFIYNGGASGLDLSTHITIGGLGLNQDGMNVAPAGDVNGDGYADLLIGLPTNSGLSPCGSSPGSGLAWVFYGSNTGPNPNLANNWVVAGCWWVGAGAGLGTSVCGAGDVNADGYDDIAIGTPGAPISGTAYGKVFIVYGSSSRLPLVPGFSNFGSLTGSTALAGHHAFAAFGSTVAPAGDLNEDGYADVAVGAPFDDTYGTDSGEAFVFRGGPAGADTSWASQLWWESSGLVNGKLGMTLTPAGDENGDGRADLLVGEASKTDLAESVSGSMLITQSLPYPSGSCRVMTAGDINGDGLSDVLVGDPNYASGESFEGRLLVHYGVGSPPAISAIWTATQLTQDNPGLGWSVAPAGDVNGDGFDDVLVSAPNYDDWTTGQVDNGLVMLFFGHGDGPSTYYDWAQVGAEGDGLGVSIAAGDLNGDGYSDIIVGAPWVAATAGEVRIWYGGSGGPSFGGPNVVLTDQDSPFQFGHSVACAGDVNGDGYPDLLVGDPYGQGPGHPIYQEGVVHLYAGGPGGIQTYPLWTKGGGQAYGHFGFSVAGAGDITGDSYADIVIGAPDFDGTDKFGNPIVDAGRVYFEFGGTGGITAERTYTATQSSLLGFSVAAAGDVNGDGYSDVIVGAPNYTNNFSHEGSARVFTGSPANLTLSWIQYGGEVNGSFGASVSSAGDVDGDGLSDVLVGAPLQNMGGPSDQGRAYVFRGPLPNNAAAFWTASGNGGDFNFGQSVANAGDVNNDGWPDLLIGEPGYSDWYSRQGLCSIYLGARGMGSFQALESYHSIAPAHYIEPGCLTDPGQLFLLSGARSAAGRSRVRLQYSVKPVIGLAAPAIDGFTPYSATGAPGTFGSVTAIFKNVNPLVAGVPYAWSVRTLARNVWYPTGPWRSPARNGRREADVRVPGSWLGVPDEHPVATLDLAGVRPNPMYASASVSFSLSTRGPVTLEVLDLQGRRVRTLAHGTLEAGPHLLEWDGHGDDGATVGSGVYFVRMQAEGRSMSHKLVRVR